MINEKTFINDIINRLGGCPTGVLDKSLKMLFLGDKVRLHINDDVYQEGIVSYDYNKKQYLIYLRKPINEFNNNECKYYLKEKTDRDNRECPIIYKIRDYTINDFDVCKVLLDKYSTPLEFFKRILDIHENINPFLTKEELDYIKLYLRNKGIAFENNEKEILKEEIIETKVIFDKEDFLKRLNGSPTGLCNSDHTENFLVEDKIKFHFDHMDSTENGFIIGNIRYNSIKKMYYLRFQKSVEKFNNGNKNLYLDFINDKASADYYINSMETLPKATYHNDYKDCIKLVDNDKQFYGKILDLFCEGKVYLSPKEIDYIENILNKTPETDIALFVSENTDENQKFLTKLAKDIENFVISLDYVDKNKIHFSIGEELY